MYSIVTTCFPCAKRTNTHTQTHTISGTLLYDFYNVENVFFSSHHIFDANSRAVPVVGVVLICERSENHEAFVSDGDEDSAPHVMEQIPSVRAENGQEIQKEQTRNEEADLEFVFTVARNNQINYAEFSYSYNSVKKGLCIACRTAVSPYHLTGISPLPWCSTVQCLAVCGLQ